MEPLLESIRLAIVTDASAEARASGAQACRSILASLEPPPQPPILQASGLPSEAIPQLAAMLRGLNIDQLLDLAVGKLRALNNAQPGPELEEPTQTLRIPLVPVPTERNKAR